MLHWFKIVYTKFYNYCIVAFLAKHLLCYVFVGMEVELYAKAGSIAITLVVIGMGVVKRR